MFKYVAPATIAIGLVLSGTALADANKSSSAPGARTNVYKESQKNAYAKPAQQSVKPNAEFSRPNLYKESQRSSYAAPVPGSIAPDSRYSRNARNYGPE